MPLAGRHPIGARRPQPQPQVQPITRPLPTRFAPPQLPDTQPDAAPMTVGMNFVNHHYLAEDYATTAQKVISACAHLIPQSTTQFNKATMYEYFMCGGIRPDDHFYGSAYCPYIGALVKPTSRHTNNSLPIEALNNRKQITNELPHSAHHVAQLAWEDAYLYFIHCCTIEQQNWDIAEDPTLPQTAYQAISRTLYSGIDTPRMSEIRDRTHSEKSSVRKSSVGSSDIEFIGPVREVNAAFFSPRQAPSRQPSPPRLRMQSPLLRRPNSPIFERHPSPVNPAPIVQQLQQQLNNQQMSRQQQRALYGPREEVKEEESLAEVRANPHGPLPLPREIHRIPQAPRPQPDRPVAPRAPEPLLNPMQIDLLQQLARQRQPLPPQAPFQNLPQGGAPVVNDDDDEGEMGSPDANFLVARPEAPKDMEYFPSIKAKSNQVKNLAVMLGLCCVDRYSFNARGKHVYDMIKDTESRFPRFIPTAFLIPAPRQQLTAYPPTLLCNPFNFLSCGFNPILSSSFMGGFETFETLCYFTHSLLSWVGDTSARGFEHNHDLRCFEVQNNAVVKLDINEVRMNEAVCPRAYHITKPLAKSPYDIMLRTYPIESTDPLYPHLITTAAWQYINQAMPTLHNDVTYISHFRPDPIHTVMIQEATIYLATKKDEFFRQVRFAPNTAAHAKFTEFFALNPRLDGVDQIKNTCSFLRALHACVVVPDQVIGKTCTYVSLESITAFDLLFKADVQIQNKHEIFLQLLTSGCNGLAGFYMYFHTHQFIVPFTMRGEVYAQNDVKLYGAVQRTKYEEYSPLLATAISMCKVPKVRSHIPQPFPQDTAVHVTQIYPAKMLGITAGFNIAAHPVIEASFFAKAVSFSKYATSSAQIPNLKGVVPNQFLFAQSYDWVQPGKPSINSYLISQLDRKFPVLNQAVSEVFFDRESVPLVAQLDLSIKTKFNFFAVYYYFLHLVQDSKKNLAVHVYTTKANSLPAYHVAYKNIFKIPQEISTSNLKYTILGGRLNVQREAADSESDNYPTDDQFQNAKRARLI